MRVAPECLPCFLTQAVKTGRILSLTDKDMLPLLREVLKRLARLEPGDFPPVIGRDIQHLFAGRTGVKDPYQKIKRACTRAALEIYPELKRKVEASPDGLETAIKLAATGNLIDFGTAVDFDLRRDLERLDEPVFSVFEMDFFRAALSKANRILYLGDNAGETVFDRLLIEELGKPVTYVVREKPIINDAVAADAAAAGLNRVADIISAGNDTPGIIPGCWSPEFQDRILSAELILSKGQGNYEGLSESPLPIFFLLKAKCSPVARSLGVERGTLVLKSQPHRPSSEK